MPARGPALRPSSTICGCGSTMWRLRARRRWCSRQFVAAPFGAETIVRTVKPLNPVLLTGRMSAAARDDAVALFTADPTRRVLVASLRAGGTGLNLTAASVVFHFDRWWNPAVEAQAEDRAHRIGQTRPVQVFSYLTPDSIEQRIAEILWQKRVLFDDIHRERCDGEPAPARLADTVAGVEGEPNHGQA